jgi:uncharacterized membrane protein
MLILLILFTGLMAGIYFAFSVFIMKALGQLPPTNGAQAMNKINDVIVNTGFLPLFFGSTLWYAGLVIWTITDWQGQASVLFIISALIYIIGMFFVTAFGNVPLNNQLKSLEDRNGELEDFWNVYLRTWLNLNHIRTLSCISSCTLLILGFMQLA